jgi:2,4-dienoyl-CoA reductase-like NADH-dependent reductase (Old Yellow Enzyme family)/thioredoxin reductase
MNAFPHLFSELTLRRLTLRNRIVSTGHHTHLAEGLPSERLIAYHEARAKGGAGLIISEIAAVHPTGLFSGNLLVVTGPECVAPYQRLAEACHRHGAKVFAQLFHPGREILATRDGTIPVAYAPSPVPNERFRIMPRPMSTALIAEVVAGYGRAAGLLRRAGLDGVEIVASHGYLPAQFLNPRVNLRDDAYGGDFDNRLRFLRQVIVAVRAAAGETVVGLRVSASEEDPNGLTAEEVLAACVALDGDGGLDYFNVTAGTSASLGGAIHISPPMGLAAAYTAHYGGAIRAKVSKPVLLAGRITQPQVAEQILARGEADLCGMTRALICDPEMPHKAAAGRRDDIRACIACNQACIGHSHKGFAISCIQHPESGREREFAARVPAERPRRVLVAGGGPAGMKAAAVAAERGHEVTLYEAAPRLGGQALLAQLLPGRAEFGGIVTNLARELELAGARVVTGTRVTAELVARAAPEVVILASGARPYRPEIPGAEEARVVTAWQVLAGEVEVGRSVVIADSACDWIGLGLAEMLTLAGSRVRLCVNGALPGEALQQYTRSHSLGRIHKLGVETLTQLRLFGVDADTVYFQHITSGEPLFCEETDTLVLSLGHSAASELEDALQDFAGEVIAIGDCLSPRTAEEAVLDGLRAGCAV